MQDRFFMEMYYYKQTKSSSTFKKFVVNNKLFEKKTNTTK